MFLSKSPVSSTTYLVHVFLSLLCTVVLKLYLTFKASAFEMSLIMIRLFAVIVSTIIVFSFTFSTLRFIYGFHGEAAPYCWALLFSCMFLYILGCFLAVYFFASNLAKLAKIQGTSLRNLSAQRTDMKLNPRQQMLADLATKSMMLFAFQIGSTIFISFVVAFAFPQILRRSIYCFDFAINLFCAHLQFAFAENHYRICCGCSDDMFRGFMLNWVKRKIFTHSLPKE